MLLIRCSMVNCEVEASIVFLTAIYIQTMPVKRFSPIQIFYAGY